MEKKKLKTATSKKFSKASSTKEMRYAKKWAAPR